MVVVTRQTGLYVLMMTGQHAAEHWALHEASDRRQGAKRVECCTHIVAGQSMLGLHFIWRRCHCVQHSVSQCLVVISFDAVVTAYNTVSVNAWSSFHLTPLSLHVTQCQSISRWVQLVSVCLCTSSSVWPVGLRVTWLVTLMVMLLIRGSIYKISYDSLTIILR